VREWKLKERDWRREKKRRGGSEEVEEKGKGIEVEE
jgi:hypothetical protein